MLLWHSDYSRSALVMHADVETLYCWTLALHLGHIVDNLHRRCVRSLVIDLRARLHPLQISVTGINGALGVTPPFLFPDLGISRVIPLAKYEHCDLHVYYLET
jgi:hypothetical protein